MAAPVVLVGAPNSTPTTDISTYIDFETMTMEDTGNQADDTASFEVVDIDLAVTAIVPEGVVLVRQDGRDRFNGFISTVEPAWEGVSRRFRITCTGLSHLLDMCIIPPSDSNTYVRSAGESSRARIIWLLETFGAPFEEAGSTSHVYIQNLEPDMPRQNFANMTLRQAIERVLGAASESANYYVDTAGRLHVWDNDNEEEADAPFKVNTALTLAADEVAPSDLRVMWDTSELVNWYYVRGRNAAGSGAYSDATSIATYGRRQAFIDGPDSDTRRKAKRLGKAALKDTKNPLVRCVFTVEDDYCENGSGEIWRPGQEVLITSPAHGMTGYAIRIIRVTTSYLNGLGSRRMEIECGALRANFLGPDQWGIGGAKYPDPSLVLQPGPPTVDSYPGLDPSSPVDSSPYPLDDFSRETSPAAAPVSLGIESGGSLATTSHSFDIPDGSNVVGRLLVVFVTNTDSSVNVQSPMVGQGFTLVDSDIHTDFEGLLFIRRIDGTEGYTGTGDSVSFSTASAVDIGFVAVLHDGVYFPAAGEDYTDYIAATSATNTQDPPSSGGAYFDGTSPVTWYAWLNTNGLVTTDTPDGYTAVGAYLQSVYKKDGTDGTEDPSAFVVTSGATRNIAWTVGVRGGGPGAGLVSTGITGTTVGSFSPGTESINLPNGMQTGDTIVAVVWNTGTTEDLASELSAQGFTIVQQEFLGTNVVAVLSYTIDGTEGWGDGSTLDWDVSTSGSYRCAMWLYRGASGVAAAYAASVNPPALDPPWPTDVSTDYWVYGFSDSGALGGTPTGYTLYGSGAAGIWFREATKVGGDGGSEDPSTFSGGGGNDGAFTIAIGGGGADGGWGSIPEGYGVDTEAPWLGGNAYEMTTVGGNAEYYVAGGTGVIIIKDDDTYVRARLFTDTAEEETDEPWGPWAGGALELLIKFKVDPLGTLTDTDGNYLLFQVETTAGVDTLRVHLGDNVNWSWMDPDQQRGFVLGNTTTSSVYSDFVAKTLAADTYYYLRWNLLGPTAKAKMWAASATEPNDWDVSLARVAYSEWYDYARFTLYAAGNTTGGNMTFTFDEIDASLGAASGSVIGRHLIAYGDGSTVTFSTDGQAFVPGTLLVWVDNQPVVPASYDSDAGTFTLGRAPYGDPADDSGSAVVEALWEVA